jgi:hypothetical protein
VCLWPYAGQENIADRAADREQPGQKPDEVERRTYEELGKELGLDPAILKKRLPLFAQELKRSPNATTYERANAAFVAKDYNEAERLVSPLFGKTLSHQLPTYPASAQTTIWYKKRASRHGNS